MDDLSMWEWRSHIPVQHPPRRGAPVTRDEICAYFEISEDTFRHWRKRGAVTGPVTLGRFATYPEQTLRDIRQILENRDRHRTLAEWAELRTYQTSQGG
jgi:DNA-binding transcriptional MerR regulator